MRIWGKKILGSVNKKCRGLEVGMSLLVQRTESRHVGLCGPMKLAREAGARRTGPCRPGGTFTWCSKCGGSRRTEPCFHS